MGLIGVDAIWESIPSYVTYGAAVFFEDPTQWKGTWHRYSYCPKLIRDRGCRQERNAEAFILEDFKKILEELNALRIDLFQDQIL